MLDSKRYLHPRDFLRLATLFEGGLVVIAYVLGWIAEIDPLACLRYEPTTLIWGVIGTLPLYWLFTVAYQLPIKRLASIKQLLIDKMGPLLAGCRLPDMIYLGLLAGITEEILFRGVLQTWMESAWGWKAGLIGSNILFAFAHWITPLYALLAGLTGLYLGISLDVGGERNLGVPILIHALYDILAFQAVAKLYREKHGSYF